MNRQGGHRRSIGKAGLESESARPAPVRCRMNFISSGRRGHSGSGMRNSCNKLAFIMQKGRVLVYNISCPFVFLREVLYIEGH